MFLQDFIFLPDNASALIPLQETGESVTVTNALLSMLEILMHVLRLLPCMADDTFQTLPDGLPVPADDGGCSHLLAGTPMPSVRLLSTQDRIVDTLTESAGKAVFFFYPMTGKPGIPLPEGWNLIPGARGCTPESCAYRDLHREFILLGFTVFGVSTQRTEEQKEFAHRNRIPYEILSDRNLEFTGALGLPTFSVKEVEVPLVKRLTIVAVKGRIDMVFYPVFPPDRNAETVLKYLNSGNMGRPVTGR